MTYDDKLHFWDKVYRAAMGWALFWGVLDAAIIAFTIRPWEHIPHRHVSTGWIQAVVVMAGLAGAGAWLSSISGSRQSYHADRAFLTRLFMASGFDRRAAERMANRKINRGG